MSLRLRRKFYRMCILRVMMYGMEPTRAAEVRRLERAERMMIRWMCGVTLKDRCKSEEWSKCLDIEDVAYVVRRGIWDGLIIWRERIRETGCQKAEIWQR